MLLFSDAVNRWVVTQPDRAAVSRQSYTFGGPVKTWRAPRDDDEVVTKKDEKRVKQIMSPA